MTSVPQCNTTSTQTSSLPVRMRHRGPRKTSWNRWAGHEPCATAVLCSEPDRLGEVHPSMPEHRRLHRPCSDATIGPARLRGCPRHAGTPQNAEVTLTPVRFSTRFVNTLHHRAGRVEAGVLPSPRRDLGHQISTAESRRPFNLHRLRGSREPRSLNPAVRYPGIAKSWSIIHDGSPPSMSWTDTMRAASFNIGVSEIRPYLAPDVL